jgi:hypothetical protein
VKREPLLNATKGFVNKDLLMMDMRVVVGKLGVVHSLLNTN